MQENVRMLFDSGSKRTYITENLARKLNLKLANKSKISLITFGSEKPKSLDTPSADLNIELKDGSVLKITANVIPSITGSMQRRSIDSSCLQNWEYLWKGNALADSIPTGIDTSKIDLLIGNDYYRDLILPQKVETQPGLYMLGSKLGWIQARITPKSIQTTEQHSLLVIIYGTDIRRQTNVFIPVDNVVPTKLNLEDLWWLETKGIHDTPQDTKKEMLLKQFNETIEYEHGRYKVSWPWQEDGTLLSENHGLALGRFKSLINRLMSNSMLELQNGNIIEDQLQQGIIEKVPNQRNQFRKHYIPHYPVINPIKTTTKVKIVYDDFAKTREENKSLNDCLYKGPVMLQDLIGILLRFRLNKIALVSDIENAFLQVSLTEESRDVTRFLWLKNRHILKLENNFQEYRF